MSPTFIDLLATGSRSSARIAAALEARLSSGRLQEVDDALRGLDPSRIDIAVVMVILGVTVAFRQQLPGWTAFLDAAEPLLRRELSSERVDRIVRNRT